MSMSYDYVIVGAGSAGCVLANRLSADPGVSVLLIEAGGPDANDLIHIPAAMGALFRTDQDWDHSTVWSPTARTAGSTCRAAGCSAARARSTR